MLRTPSQQSVKWIGLIGLIVALSSVLAISDAPDSGIQLEEYQTVHQSAVQVVLPNDHNLQWENFWVALGGGFFQEEDVDVTTIIPPRPQMVVMSLLQGEADVALLPPPRYLNLIGQQKPIVIFANLLENDPINLVVRKEIAEERSLSDDLPLEDRLTAMQGLRIGVAPGPVTRLRVLFQSAGLDVETDIEMVILEGEVQNEAFAEGQVDALYAHTPFLERALVEQEAVMLVNQSSGEVPALADRQIHTLVTTRNFANEHPEVLVRLTKAVFRAQRLIHADPQATSDALRDSGVQLQEPDGLKTILAIQEPAIPDTPEVSVAGVLQAVELFPAHRTPPDLSEVDLEKFVDSGFAEQAVEELGNE